MGKDPVNKRSPSLVVQLPQEPSAPSSSPTLARTALAPAPTGGPSPPARSRLSGREEGGGKQRGATRGGGRSALPPFERCRLAAVGAGGRFVSALLPEPGRNADLSTPGFLRQSFKCGKTRRKTGQGGTSGGRPLAAGGRARRAPRRSAPAAAPRRGSRPSAAGCGAQSGPGRPRAPPSAAAFFSALGGAE